MTTIHTFELDATFTQMTLDLEVANGFLCTALKLYIGDDYLSDDFVDLSVYIQPTERFVTFLTPDTPEIAAVYSKDIFDGVFTIVIESSEGAEFITGRSLVNLYSSSLCLAHKILALDDPKKLNETNMLYLYMQATATYIVAGQTEQALGAYDRVEAIVTNAGDDFLKTDIAPCGEGTGCWIVNGVYVVKF
jgi:hypothetical protein